MRINWFNFLLVLVAVAVIFGAGCALGLVLNDANDVATFQTFIIGSLCFLIGGAAGVYLEHGDTDE